MITLLLIMKFGMRLDVPAWAWALVAVQYAAGSYMHQLLTRYMVIKK